MLTLQMVATVVLFLIAGGLGLKLSLLCVSYLTGRSVGMDKLFDGLRAKLWMTGGVGLFFFSFYVLIVLFGANLINFETRLKLFNLMYNHPTFFIYLGLFLFVFISLSILIVRSIIKHIYNSRG